MATSIEAPHLDDWGLGQVKISKKKTKKGVRIHTLPTPPPPPAEQDAWEPEAPVEKASYDDDMPCEPEVTTEYGLSARDPEPCAACDIPAPEAKEEPTSEKPDECEATREAIPEPSDDWDFMAPAEPPVDETPTEDIAWAKEESAAAETEPTKAYKEPAEEAKPVDVEACGDCIPEEKNTICLPFGSQHKLMVHLQEVLEGACFAYGQRNLAGILRERGWDCVEAVALHTWMNEFPAMTETFDTIHGRELLQSVVDIQDIAAKRTRIDWSRMKKLLDDAFELTEVLNVKEYSDIVQKVRIDIGKAVEGLSCKEQEAEDQQEEKLQRIAEERRKLDRCEVEVRKYKENRTRDYRKWAESEVEGILEETRKTLKTAIFFLKLVD
ncbi:hypothetical protein IL306_004117 [Fusarium sp. DS 682]|nr:hypothetical protein IL306_004117 [Fusarium sp. DS 682]KAH7471696.1 hypothetical protein FOMA001_g13478 [Fusarium oxysporum f. sp. matthiolae]